MRTILNAFRNDALTGLLNREEFFKECGRLIKRREAGYYVLSCVDIENFKVINDQYGVDVGDEVLRHIAEKLSHGVRALGGICCRYTADKFGALYPAEHMDSEAIRALHAEVATGEHLGRTVRIRVGRYLVDDLSVPVSAMYDRATMAEESLRGRYDAYIAQYTDSMRADLLSEQQIVNDMDGALQNDEFKVWLQPQYNHATGALIGAEALVRWEKGGELVPPGKFIPVFERNGFIYQMDQYIWDRVCRLLRRWLDEGLSPLPVSVNISRRDLFHTDFIERLTGLVKKYALPSDLLRLEVTESAFAEASGQIISKVGELIGLGFTVEIDDFGSGYSSLNTLKDVPAAILKLDMKFFENTKNQQRGGNIVESVVRMAKWLGMAVIAEGVEDKNQADYLRSIGCYYIQGYYYSKPIPAAEYERLLSESGKEPELSRLETLKTLDNSEFWNPRSMETLIFNSYVGGACIFEYCNERSELLRVSGQYARELGGLIPEGSELKDSSLVRFLDAEGREDIRGIIRRAIDEQKEFSCEVRLSDGGRTEYVRVTVRLIARAAERFLFYGVIVNMTEQREAERKQLESARQLEVIMSNVSGGVSAILINDDGTSKLIFNNDKYYELYGYTKEQALSEQLDVMTTILPEDLPGVMEKVKKLKSDGISAIIDYRCKKRGGKLAYLHANASLMQMDGFGAVITAVVTDITEKKELEEQLRAIVDNIYGGVSASVIRDGKPEFVVVNDQFFKILGYTSRAEFEAAGTDQYTGLYPDDRERIIKQFESSDGGKTQYTMEYRVIRRDGSLRYIRNNIRVIHLFGVDEPVQLSVANDITDLREAQQKELAANDQLRFLNDSAHDILAQPDSEVAINKTLENLMAYFDGDRSYVIEFDYERQLSSNTYEKCAPGVASEMELLQAVPLSVSEYWIDTLKNDRLIVIDDVDKLEDDKAELRALLLEQSIRSLIVAPLWRDGVLVGFVGIDNPMQATDQFVRLKALGDYIAILLARRDLSAKIDSDQKMMAALMDDTPGGFVRMKLESPGTFVPVYSNAGFGKLVGMSREELGSIYGRDVLGGVHPDDREIVKSAGERMLSDGEAQSARFRVLSGSGEYIWLTLYGRMTKDASGGTYLNVYYSDVTKQVSEEQRQKELLDNLPCGAALYEYDGKGLSVVHINKSYWELVGRTGEDYSKTSVFGVIHPDDRLIVRQEIDTAIRQGRNALVRIRILCGGSVYRPFRIDAKLTPEKNGKYLFFAAYTPISEAAMSVQEMLPIALSTMMSASEDLSYVKDRDLHYICCSESVAKSLGLSSAMEIVGKTDFDLFDKKLAEEFVSNDRRIVESGESLINRTERVPGPNGAVRLANTSKYPIMDTSGNVIGLYGVSRDITAQREKESQLELLTSSIPGGLAAYSISEAGISMLYFNDGFYEFSGYSREDYEKTVKRDPLAFVFEEDKPAIREMIRGFAEHKTDGHINGCVYRCHTRDGGYRWMSMKSVLSKLSDSQFIVNIVQLDITEQQEEKERLRVSEELNRLAIAQSGKIITRFDVKSRTLTLPDSFSPIFVLPQVLSNMPEEQIALGRVSPDTSDIYRELFEGIIRGEAYGSATYKQNSTKGWRWLDARYTTVFSSGGSPVSAVISFTDITEELEKEVVYNKWQQSLDERPEDSYTLFRCNLSKGASFDSREGSLLRVSFDDSATTFDDRTREYVEQCVYADDRERYLEFINSDTLLAEYYRGHRTDAMEYREAGPDGGIRWLRLTVDLVEYPISKDVEVYLMYEDIDEQKKAKLLTLERSETDPLTGILNRAAFIVKMERLLASSKPGEKHALLMLDVDNFKHINDSLGHGAGDEVLKGLTEHIGAILRHDDLIGRLGGDEFFVFLKDVPNAEAAAAKAKQICALRVTPRGAAAPVTVSVGIAMIPRDGSDFDELYKKADAALYRQKESGKDGYLFVSD